MKPHFIIPMAAALGCALSLLAQEPSSSTRGRAGLPPATPTGNYASDVGVLIDAQGQALEQARKALEEPASATMRVALEAAIKEMERSQAALERAKQSPDHLPAALAAEQSAYQALIKATPREHRMTRSRGRNQSGSSAGQPNQQELDQLEMTDEEKRYETERQAASAPTKEQREQAQTVDRLKQMARRQQDMNDRLRDLQTALQQARNDQERQEVQRQLKRLRDEERQLLSDVDELRQRLEQSPEAARQSDTRQQLEQTHTDVQKAAQELEKQSVSEALAAGSRAEQNLQNLRENLRQQTSSQFAEQMRRAREQARALADRESQIASALDALNHAEQKTLDTSAQRRALVEQMSRQRDALTNILDQIRAVTERAESTEPLLSKQLYDLVRRADQARTDSQLEIGERLLERGFLPEASQTETAARKNIDELRRSVDNAAESVLGSEAQALRYAQKELDDLARQAAREITAATNPAVSLNGGGSPDRGQTNSAVAAAREGSPSSAQTKSTASSPEGISPGQSQAGSPAPSAEGGLPGRGGTNAATSPSGEASSGQGQGTQAATAGGAGGDPLRQFAQQLGGGSGGLGDNGPITGNNYMDWADRMRDVEQAVDSQDVRNQLATVRERVGVYRRNYRQNGRVPSGEELGSRVLAPLALARDWVGQELSRAQNDRNLVPLDRDPVQEKYSELVRKYYETLGSQQ